jgi:hypothetical protein
MDDQQRGKVIRLANSAHPKIFAEIPTILMGNTADSAPLL